MPEETITGSAAASSWLRGVTPAYTRYVLGALTVVYTLNYFDRGMIILQLQQIKLDLRLSDTQLGFLTGIAFGLFYAVLGVPIARWSDRGNRSSITALAIGLWGITVTMCLYVATFPQLVAARVAAAVGEAGCMPPTYSLLGDYFPGARERTRAMTIYMLSGPVATLLSFMAGGWLNERYGWRVGFAAMGLPAILIAMLFKATVIDPRGQARSQPLVPHAAPTIGAAPALGVVLRSLWRRRSARHLSLAIVGIFMMGLGLAPWYAAFMIRSHGMNTAELGVWLGLIFGISGIAGIVAGGFAAARWLIGNERGQLRICATLSAALLPCYSLFLLVPQKTAALLALIPLIFIFSLFLGPAFALMQRLVPDDMRATSVSVVMLLANLIGMGLGPQTVGSLSDWLQPLEGGDSLRYAMLIVAAVVLWPAIHFWRAGETIQSDLPDSQRTAGRD